MYSRMLRRSKATCNQNDILVGLNENPKLIKKMNDTKCEYFGHILSTGVRYQ